jgi:hypothetical protein
MKHIVVNGSDAMIYIPSFIKTGSAILKLMGLRYRERERERERQDGARISLLNFVKISQAGCEKNIRKQDSYIILRH